LVLLNDHALISGSHPLYTLGQVVTGFLSRANPYAGLSTVLGSAYSGSIWPASATPLLVLAAMGYGLAAVAFRRLSANVREGEPAGRRKRPEGRRWGAPPRPNADQPILWKERYFYFRHPLTRLGYPLFLLALSAVVVVFHFEARSRRSWMTWQRTVEEIGWTFFFYGVLLLISRVGSLLATIFAREIRDQTFSTLATLPGGLQAVVRQKLGAVTRFALPDLVLIAVGLVLVRREWITSIANSLTDPMDLLSSISFFALLVACTLVFWLFCLLYSLRLKRGAVFAPMGAGSLLFSFFIGVGLSGGGGGEGTFMGICWVGLIACFITAGVTLNAIITSLDAAASE
jgi:hypothetical protein